MIASGHLVASGTLHLNACFINGQSSADELWYQQECVTMAKAGSISCQKKLRSMPITTSAIFFLNCWKIASKKLAIRSYFSRTGAHCKSDSELPAHELPRFHR